MIFRRSFRGLRIPVVAAIVVSIAGVGHAQTVKIDDYVNAELEKRKIPGLSIAVVHN